MTDTPILRIPMVAPTQNAKTETINSAVIALTEAGNRRETVTPGAVPVSKFTRAFVLDLDGAGQYDLPAAERRVFAARNVGAGTATLAANGVTFALAAGESGLFCADTDSFEAVLLSSGGTGGGGGTPSGPVDHGMEIDASAGDVSVDADDYVAHRLFTVTGAAFPCILTLPNGVENLVAVTNSGGDTLDVRANGGSVILAQGETATLATSLTALVKVGSSLAPATGGDGGTGGPPAGPVDHGLAVNLSSGAGAVTAEAFPAYTVFIAANHSTGAILTLPDGIEHTFVVVNTGSAVVTVACNGATVAIPPGDARACYTTVSLFRSITTQTSSGGGSASGTQSLVLNFYASDPAGQITLTQEQFLGHSMFLGSLLPGASVLTVPFGLDHVFLVANRSNAYPLTVSVTDGATAEVPPGETRLFFTTQSDPTPRTITLAPTETRRRLIPFSKTGALPGATTIGLFVAPRDMKMRPADQIRVAFGTPPSGTPAVSLKLNGTTLVNVGASGAANMPDWAVAAGDLVSVTFPGDPAAADIAVSFYLRDSAD